MVKNLGWFIKEEDAAKAYNKAALERFDPEFIRVNNL